MVFVAEIEQRLALAIINTFGLDISALALDMTNFATYIDSGNDKAPIAQRGKAKQKRTDLRLVGLHPRNRYRPGLRRFGPAVLRRRSARPTVNGSPDC